MLTYARLNYKIETFMYDNNVLNRLESGLRAERGAQAQTRLLRANKQISDARMILYDLQVFIKLGALAGDSGIIDEDLRLNKDKDDYYILFRTLNNKLQKAIDILQT